MIEDSNAKEQELIYLVTDYVATYRSLPPVCAKILGVLFVKAGVKGLSTVAIAGLLNSKISTISNTLNFLSRLGYVKVVPDRNQAHCYTLDRILFFKSYHSLRLRDELNLGAALFKYKLLCSNGTTKTSEVRCIEIYTRVLLQCKAMVERIKVAV